MECKHNIVEMVSNTIDIFKCLKCDKPFNPRGMSGEHTDLMESIEKQKKRTIEMLEECKDLTYGVDRINEMIEEVKEND